MKATDIMIGDILRTERGEIIEVKAINGSTVYYSCGKIAYIDELEPIEITKKFMKANGFELKQDYFGTMWVHELWSFRSLSGNDIFFKDCKIHCHFIKYVNELQHALRLFGLDELADNLKLK